MEDPDPYPSTRRRGVFIEAIAIEMVISRRSRHDVYEIKVIPPCSLEIRDVVQRLLAV